MNLHAIPAYTREKTLQYNIAGRKFLDRYSLFRYAYKNHSTKQLFLSEFFFNPLSKRTLIIEQGFTLWYNKTTWKGGDWMEEEYMTGKEIVNLITALEREGMKAEKIIEIIKFVETHDPKEQIN